jgi:DNA repair protein RecN (Recombination protein N)
MLVELAIQNLVIVESARLAPGEGLCVISGETGAGKSLLLDALEMVSGGRMRVDLVGARGDAATVTAVIQVAPARARAVEAACAVAAVDGQYLLRRRIGSGGRSQAWINDVPVTVGALKAAAALLIEVHAQHEALRLADPAEQLAVLDAYGALDERATAYRAAHDRAQHLTRTLAELDGGERESVKELDYLTFQARELESLKPERGEFAALEARHSLLSAAGQWREAAEQAVQALSEDERAVATVLGRFAKRLSDAPEPKLAEAGRSCAQALEAVRDAAASCSDVIERLNADPTELGRIEDRLNAYHELLRKHGDGAGDDEAALFGAWERISARIHELSTIGERREQAAAELAQARESRARLGRELAQARAKAFAKLAKEAHAHLSDLGMPKARLALAEVEQSEPTTAGVVRQEFTVQTNPGQPAGRLGEIASGGEAARIALALAEALAERDPVPVLVFDEVDSGVGGRLGAVIGAKLARLGESRTVLAVTHTPQLAAAAHRQYLVSKLQGERSTRVTVSEVAGDARLKEISEMLGGGRAAIDQARALLTGGARA